jgi:hypothetical protein
MKLLAAAVPATTACLLLFLLSATALLAPLDGAVGDGPPKPRDEKSTIAFQDATRTSRIDFTLRNSISPQRYSIETMAGGVALFDYNNDGLLDIFFTNGAKIPSLEKTSPDFYNRLFRNNGDGTFTDVTEKRVSREPAMRWAPRLETTTTMVLSIYMWPESMQTSSTITTAMEHSQM